MTKKSGFVVAAAMAGLSAGVAIMADGCQHKSNSGSQSGVQGNAGTVGANTTAAAEKHDCKGKNSCKGKGGCSSGDKGCAGKNTCQGKGGCETAMAKP